MLTRALNLLPPESAHRLAIWGLAHRLVPGSPPERWPRLATRLCGLDLPNPLGLAAGFDKNAQALPGLARLGFGFIEIGTVTPRPQAGNPRPRMFRLPADEALINRLGFNSQGVSQVRARLADRDPGWGVIGANIGANRDAKDPIEDYVAGLSGLYDLVDYITVNVSSPNAPGRPRCSCTPPSSIKGRAWSAACLRSSTLCWRATAIPICARLSGRGPDRLLHQQAETRGELRPSAASVAGVRP
jgi:dihydroorotate dehydrogenase